MILYSILPPLNDSVQVRLQYHRGLFQLKSECVGAGACYNLENLAGSYVSLPRHSSNCWSVHEVGEEVWVAVNIISDWRDRASILGSQVSLWPKSLK